MGLTAGEGAATSSAVARTTGVTGAVGAAAAGCVGCVGKGAAVGASWRRGAAVGSASGGWAAADGLFAEGLGAGVLLTGRSSPKSWLTLGFFLPEVF